MAESDETHSDDELNQAAKDGTIREGTARIHHKLFPKYGFLSPDNPAHPGETIFFGLTAHVDASKKYIADLREELKPDQRVKYMAVPVERDGVIKWKGLVVAPLPAEQQHPSNAEEQINDNQEWLTCKILPNLQPLRGFATPEGGNQYHDNVYFSTREASEGLGVEIADLTTVFRPGETVKALVVPADPRFKARYKALKICKVAPAPAAIKTPPPSNKEDCLLVEEMDQSAVSWIYSVLEAKGSVKLTNLAGNLSHHPEVRTVVQPQKKSVRKFLAKYPRFFNIKEDAVSLDPKCPPLRFTPRSDKSINSDSQSFEDSNWSDSDDSSASVSDRSPTPAPSPVPYSSQTLKSADIFSKFTSSMLASIIKSLPEPVKMAELFKICQQKGWEGMVSVAMVAQVITNNRNYFQQDERGCIVLTPQGAKLSVKRVDSEHASTKTKDTKTSIAPNFPAPPIITTSVGSSSTSLHTTTISSAFSAFSSLSKGDGLQSSRSLFSSSMPSSIYSTGAGFSNMLPGLSTNSIFSPVATDPLSSGSLFQPYDSTTLNAPSNMNNIFPTSSILSPPVKNAGVNYGNGCGNVYQSDAEDSFEEKHKLHNKGMSSSHYTEDEGRFLSTVARAICPNAVGGNEEVFKMLKKELDAMGITQGDADGYGPSGLLSRHLLCIQLDVGKVPRAEFQHFTPSGKITQTTVTLSAEKVTQNSFSTMLNTSQSNVKKVGNFLYGINKTFHCIIILVNDLDEMIGCTISFRSHQTMDVRMSDLLEFGERRKTKIILTDSLGGTSSGDACASLRKYGMEKSVKSTVMVVDMEGQIFGFGNPAASVRRIVCGTLDAQQRHLKEVVHHHPNLVIANAIDCEESLMLLQRISAKGISIYAEVARSLERNVRKLFEY